MMHLALADGLVVQRRPEGGSFVTRVTGGFSASAPPEVLVVDENERPVSSPTAQWRPSDADGLALVVQGLPPGGPFQLRLTHASQTVSRQFYVGDLWLLAGQSNMEGVGLLAEGASPHPLVRAFSMARAWGQAAEPLHFLAESPDVVHNQGKPCPPQDVPAAKAAALRGAGVGLTFAKAMVEATGVPQGLIATAHGGTSMTQWSPRLEPGGASLYGSMMLSVRAVDQPLAGVLWFQGCSDATDQDEALYTQRMIELVATLRSDLGQPDLPWLTVQIGVEIGRNWQTEAWHRIQEHQRRLPEVIARLDVCASADLEHDDWIHVSARAFPSLAQRLARQAQRLVLGQPERPMPQPLSARWAPDAVSPAIDVEFANTEGDLRSAGLPLGFTLADAALRERSLVYQVRFEGSRARLRLTDDDLTGISVFHGLGAEPQINTYDGRGLPLPVFGPLAIEGLPPLSPWFRSWRVSEPLTRPLTALSPGDANPIAVRRFEGWNVIDLYPEWAGVDQCRLAFTTAVLPEAMDLVVKAGGDGPLRVWFGGSPVIDDPRPIDDLAIVRTSAVQRVGPGRVEICVAMNNRGGAARGFCLRLLRTDAPAGHPAHLLPSEALPDNADHS